MTVERLREKLSRKEKEIYEKLKEVKDPEFGFSIVERNLVDEIYVTHRQIIHSASR